MNLELEGSLLAGFGVHMDPGKAVVINISVQRGQLGGDPS